MEKTTFDAEVKAAQREYFKAWRAANKDKVREHNRRYWEKLAVKRMQERKQENTKQEEKA